MFLIQGVALLPQEVLNIVSNAGMLGTGLILVICGVEDIKYKEIRIKHLMWMVPFLGLDIVFHPELKALERLFGLLLGGLFLAISKFTRGRIGMGDGYVLCVIGTALGFFRSMELLCYGMLLAALLSIVLLSFRIYDRKKTIPFIPFLMLGYLSCLVVHGG